MIDISVVIAVYRSQDTLQELYKRLLTSLSQITNFFEIIMVEDCGNDNSWNIIKEIAEQDIRVKAIKFSRNFGQHHAVTAGIDYAKGEWVVLMDCDLQDPPEDIINLHRTAQDGYDIVLGRRHHRKDSIIKILLSKIFFKIFDYFSGTKTDPTVGTFRILSRKVCNSYSLMKEQLRFFDGLLQWLGYRTTYINVSHASRYSGKSTYTLRKLLRLSTDAVIAFSEKPLKMSVFIGLAMSIFSAAYAIYVIYLRIIYNTTIQGYTSIIVSIYFIGGLTLFNLGILGLYIGKIFNETKKRPLYVIDEMVNL